MTTISDDATILQLWLNRQSSPHTRDCYQRDSTRLLAHVAKPLKQIVLGDLQGFADSLAADGLAPGFPSRTIAAVKSLFGFCQRTRYLAYNPASELNLPRYPNRLSERILGEQDVQRVLAAELCSRDKALLTLLYVAGLRVSEACGLCWKDLFPQVNGGFSTVFGKNGRTRSIALPPPLWSQLSCLRGLAAVNETRFSIAEQNGAG
ncbi:MAG: tyrosine-type recombinase/integrase [Acidobacteriia bacterium]|nr:tyrosine-type recombinase/integrase [Terriglobia bacterium]